MQDHGETKMGISAFYRSLTIAAVVGAALSAAPPLPTIFVAGDSAANGVNAPGWGDLFASFFDPAKATVANRAQAGESSRAFFTQRWQPILDGLKQGDFVLLQFDRNDAGPLEAGGSLPGSGEETREAATPDGKQETVHTYGWYMRRIVAEARSKGATPIVLSLTVRNVWKDGKVERESGRIDEWAAGIARATGVPFVDATAIVADGYERMGEAKVRALFPGDDTHTNPEGAEFNAAAVVAGLKALPGNRIGAFLSAKRRTRATTSSSRALGAERPRRGYVQDRATRSRCQRSRVAGVTRKVLQRSRLRRRARLASTARSVGEYRGRATWRRSTASWWRSTAISTSFWSGDGPSRRRSRRRRTSKKVSEQPMATILADPRSRCSDPGS